MHVGRRAVGEARCWRRLASAQLVCWIRVLCCSFRRHRVHPDLPWVPGEVYAVAVHLRRGDIMHENPSAKVAHRRAVVSEDELLFAMDAMRKAIVDAGENHGQAIVFHVFTQVRKTTPAHRWETQVKRR
jgi:hypothetical protein